MFYFIALDSDRSVIGLYDSVDKVPGSPPHILQVPVNSPIKHGEHCMKCHPHVTRASFLRENIGSFAPNIVVKPFDNHFQQFSSIFDDEDDGDVPMLVKCTKICD